VPLLLTIILVYYSYCQYLVWCFSLHSRLPRSKGSSFLHLPHSLQCIRHVQIQRACLSGGLRLHQGTSSHIRFAQSTLISTTLACPHSPITTCHGV
jgi:hypothetical protein